MYISVRELVAHFSWSVQLLLQFKTTFPINTITQSKHFTFQQRINIIFSFAHFLSILFSVCKTCNRKIKHSVKCCNDFMNVNFNTLVSAADSDPPHLYTLQLPPEWSPQGRYSCRHPSPWWVDRHSLCCSPASPGFLDTEDEEWFREKEW